MALGNLTKDTVLFTDTNIGKYVASSTTIVNEIRRISVSKPKSSIRTREDNTQTPQQTSTFTYYENIWNVTTLQFDQVAVSVSFVADSAVSSTDIYGHLSGLITAINAAMLTQCRNGLQ